MPVQYKLGRNRFMRSLIRLLRRWLGRKRRVTVWNGIGRQVMAQSGYQRGTPLFKSIEIETRTRCNSQCSFCAANVLLDKREDILMPTALYEKVLTELAALDYSGSIKFFVNNEPLLDKRTPDFIRMAREQVPKARTEVFTNGLKLNVKSGRELMEAGLQYLYINNYTTEGKMHRGVKAFLDEVGPGYPDREIVYHLRKLDEKLQNRGGTAPNLEALDQALPLPCILPFEELILTADGRVTICCQDHYFDSAVGNLHDQTLENIWNNPAMEALRAHLLQGDRSQHELCAGCDFRGFKEEHLNTSQLTWSRLVGDHLHG